LTRTAIRVGAIVAEAVVEGSQAVRGRYVREHTSSARGRVELLTVSGGAFLVSLSQSLLVPVLAILPAELHTSANTVEWLLTSTLLVGAVCVPLLGRLGDMFGKRLMLMVAVGALTVGSLLDSFTDNIPVLIIGRALQGVSLAAIPLGISLLTSLLPADRVRAAIAVISAMLGVGGALGLPLAGIVAQHADFHVLFWITAGAGAAVLVAIWAVVPEAPSRTGGRVDLIGASILSAALVALLLPLAQGQSWGWTAPATLGLLGVSAVLVAVLILVELRVRTPLVDMRATARRPIVLTNLASVLFGFALFAGLIGTAGYVQAPRSSGYGFGSSIIGGGLTMLPGGLVMLLLAPLAARMIGSWGARQCLVICALVVALGWAFRIAFTADLWMIVVGNVIGGVGTGIGYATMPTLINRNTPPGEIAAANGLNSLARALGGSVVSAIGGSLLAASTLTVGGVAYPTLGAYRTLFALCVVAALAAAVAAAFIPAGTPRSEESLPST
jgi:MFS family permease